MGMIVSWMLVAAAIGAFAVTALSGCFVIPALHKLHFGQTIRESGPTWHNKKQGTPTMGGLCFIFGILVACGLVYAGFYRYAQDLLGIVQVRAALLALFLAFGSGFIGFLDDYIKVVKHRNLGLLAWQKLIMQFIVTGGFLVGLHMQGLLTTIIMLPFIGAVDLGWVYYPIAFFGIIFLVNAVNLTEAGWAVVREVNEALMALRLEVFAGISRRDMEATLRVFAAIENAATETPVTTAKG